MVLDVVDHLVTGVLKEAEQGDGLMTKPSKAVQEKKNVA